MALDNDAALPCEGKLYQRADGTTMCRVLEDIVDGQKEIVVRLDKMEAANKQAREDITVLKGAFPDGDVEGHKRYHQTMIQMLEEKRQLRQAVKEKTISGLVWLAIVGIGTAVWHELQSVLLGTK